MWIAPIAVAVTATVALATQAAVGSTVDPAKDRGGAGAAATSGQRAHAGVVVNDIVIRHRDRRPVSAYVVRPAGKLPPHSQAGIVFLHWLGQIHNDRSEYLSEAVALAGDGVVSVLPQGTFPWVASPGGTRHDVALVRHQTDLFAEAVDRLASIRAVDTSRIALVGHDYGAMYATLIADRDSRVSALVLETPDATWGNWFATYWLGLKGRARARYVAMFAALDPVRHAARLGRHVFIQWAGSDVYIPAKVRHEYAVHAPDAKVTLYPDADHQLTDQAQADRDASLIGQLGLSPDLSRGSSWTRSRLASR